MRTSPQNGTGARTLEIKLGLLQQGVSMADIARAVKRSRAMVSKVVNGAEKSAHIEDAIALATKKRVGELFPYRD